MERRGSPHGYAEALERVGAITARDTAAVNPLGRTRLMTHGARVGKVIVLLHGLTASPAQFEPFGELLFEQRCNVLIPRMPHHGLADRLTDDLRHLTAEELTDFTDEVVDAARGLGEHLTVLGLSMGGTLAAWIAQHRRDVDHAVLVAPAVGLWGLWRPATWFATSLTLRLPNLFLWWHPFRRARFGPAHGYPRFCTHAVGECLRIGCAVLAAATHQPPRARHVLVVTSGGDRVVNGRSIAELARRWHSAGARNVDAVSLQIPGAQHEIIDPEQAGKATERVYPALIELINRRRRSEPEDYEVFSEHSGRLSDRSSGSRSGRS